MRDVDRVRGCLVGGKKPPELTSHYARPALSGSVRFAVVAVVMSSAAAGVAWGGGRASPLSFIETKGSDWNRP